MGVIVKAKPSNEFLKFSFIPSKTQGKKLNSSKIRKVLENPHGLVAENWSNNKARCNLEGLNKYYWWLYLFQESDTQISDARGLQPTCGFCCQGKRLHWGSFGGTD